MEENDEKMDKKLQGYEFWEKTLGKPSLVVAPMVDQSELAWRMFSRKYGAHLCYTPMFHASVFTRNVQYRKDALTSCDGDRPLIVQFCANNPDVLIQAALMAQDHCDAIDINLGCPQTIARRGYYGAFLADNWPLVEKLVKVCHERLKIPVTCKIRIFSDIQKTVDYAKMLERAGCQLLTVHGRTKEMKGPMTGLANWEHIKAIKEALSIPVFANGNIQYKKDIERCMKVTGVDGVMTAEGNLHNPMLFIGGKPVIWEMAFEYLDYVEKYPPCPTSYARGHVFKLCHHGLRFHTEARDLLSASRNIFEMRKAVEKLQELCKGTCWKESDGSDSAAKDKLPFQHWFCQPYVRPPPKKKTDQKNTKTDDSSGATVNDLNISKKKMKKLKKRGHNVNDFTSLNPDQKAAKIAKFLSSNQPTKIVYDDCVRCGNPRGNKCVLLCCKPCCKVRMRDTEVICPAHKNFKKLERRKLNSGINQNQQT
ncbi:tRNA-dihydrouridine(16/17) synthase [NAD(P)(+)]-like [Clavelina lepadiformis]|uniref:tRNA-dihydrouridine(16/17) synthase [NAD(P)(+)] n=1 Tax=Clavelina lepadiformis TaxID=159417 RepID=A0ABP0GBY8_CLALP